MVKKMSTLDRLHSLSGGHIEECIMESMQKYLIGDRLAALMEKAFKLVDDKVEAHWLKCPDSQQLKSSLILGYFKLGLLQNVMQMKYDRRDQDLLNAASALEYARMAYEGGDTYAEVLQGGPALARYLDLHHRALNFSIGYILTAIDTLPNKQSLIQTINIASKQPHMIAYVDAAIPKDFPEGCREKLRLQHLLMGAIESIYGRSLYNKISHERHHIQKTIVHGLRPQLQCRSCPLVMMS